jgi:hypothetical protein
MSNVWLTDVVKILRRAGVEAEGLTHKRGRYAGQSWKQVGWNGLGYDAFKGIMWHHDASPEGDSPGALDWCMYDAFGFPPAAAAWVDRRGKWWVYAAGRTNHAGIGTSALSGPDNGNAVFFGIETDHNTGEAWPEAQVSSLRRGTAAILRAYKLDPRVALIGHKEYAPGRKNDPDGLDMPAERRRVAKLVSTPQTGWRALLTKWFGLKG